MSGAEPIEATASATLAAARRDDVDPADRHPDAGAALAASPGTKLGASPGTKVGASPGTKLDASAVAGVLDAGVESAALDAGLADSGVVIGEAITTVPPSEPAPVLPRLRASASDIPWLIAGAILASWIAVSISRARESLPEGLLAKSAALAQGLLRLLAIAFAAWIIAAAIPENFQPALPWLLLGAAAAVGWSARDLLPDLLAGLLLRMERKLEPGTWITTEGAEGEVESIGLRATIITSASGVRIAVPNRKLSSSTVALDRARWPLIELSLRAPASCDPAVAEAVIKESVLLSPYLAPDADPAILRETDGDARAFIVRARILEGRFRDTFASALRSRVEERLS